MAVAIIGFVSFLGYGAFQTWRNVHEAYAAWDTGTLLVEYMKTHDNQWPKSWDDLITVMEGKTERDFMLRGRGSLDRKYAYSLRESIFVDWNFNPRLDNYSSPIKRLDGKSFPVTWQDAEPNKMIRAHLESRPKAKAN